MIKILALEVQTNVEILKAKTAKESETVKTKADFLSAESDSKTENRKYFFFNNKSLS